MDLCLDLGWSQLACCTARRLRHLQIDFDESLLVVLLRAELRFRRTLQRCDHRSLPVSVRELELAIRVRSQWVDRFSAEFFLALLPRHATLVESDWNFKLVVVVVSSFLERVQADNLHV